MKEINPVKTMTRMSRARTSTKTQQSSFVLPHKCQSHKCDKIKIHALLPEKITKMFKKHPIAQC